MGKGNRKTESGGANKPFTVRAKLGRPPGPVSSAERPSDPIFFDAAGPVMGVIADAKLNRLKHETAVSLLLGHVKLLAQVLGLKADTLPDVIAEVGTLLYAEELRATPVDVGPLDAVDLPASGEAGG